jgi:hypothetical protein
MTKTYRIVHKIGHTQWAALDEVFPTFEAACQAKQKLGEESVIYTSDFFAKHSTSFLDGCTTVFGVTSLPENPEERTIQ